ncbi:MAG: alpha/beta hydrolase [Pseudomonadales bacterium]|nr:alpha/beta hydrolase [Pseudomonadales bacterium]
MAMATGVLGMLLLVACEVPDVPKSVPASWPAWLGDCQRPEDLALVGLYAEGRCGQLAVAEDPRQPDGRMIDLAVMVLPAIARMAAPDPVFFLAGGPGQSAIETGPGVFQMLPKLRRQRDIVLVDQRGTGASNSLACGTTDPQDDFRLSAREQAALQVARLQTCLPTLNAAPALYTTAMAVQDLEAVRQALGYTQINLFGISYGTRVALVYLREFPQRVRALLLDGVAPPDISIVAEFVQTGDAALDRLFADCQAVAACAQAFPDLAPHFGATLQRLVAAPQLWPMRHPGTGVLTDSWVDAQLVTGIVRQVLYQRTLSTLLPLALEQAWGGDYQTLLTLGYQFSAGADSISLGMMASVFCAEDMAQAVLLGGADGGAGTAPGKYFSPSMTAQMAEICQFWPAALPPVGAFAAVSSAAPVLLISGELDPVTPPAFAERALSTLTNARHVVVAGVGHNAAFSGCVPRLLSEFIEDLAPQALDLACLENIQRPPFFTSNAGPGRLIRPVGSVLPTAGQDDD